MLVTDYNSCAIWNGVSSLGRQISVSAARQKLDFVFDPVTVLTFCHQSLATTERPLTTTVIRIEGLQGYPQVHGLVAAALVETQLARACDAL